MLKDKRNDSFERKGGYASARVPRTEMKPPPASASQPANVSSGGRRRDESGSK
jgi:hypothetical protein